MSYGIRGNVGKRFREIKKNIAAAIENGRPAELFKQAQQLFKIRAGTRLPLAVDPVILTTFTAYQKMLTERPGSNNPEQNFREFAQMMRSPSTHRLLGPEFSIEKQEKIWTLLLSILFDLYKPVQYDFFLNRNSVEGSVRDAMDFVQQPPELARQFANLACQKLNLGDTAAMKFGFEAFERENRDFLRNSKWSMPYLYAFSLIDVYIRMWNTAHYYKVGPEIFDREFDKLIANLKTLSAEETAKALQYVLGKMEDSSGDYSFVRDGRIKALEAILRKNLAAEETTAAASRPGTAFRPPKPHAHRP